jgi:hypothetical protein
MLERHGVEHNSKSSATLQKRVETNLKKRGVKYPTQCPDVRAKVIETNMARLGVDSPMKSEQVRRKTEETCLERFGYKTGFMNQSIKEKSKTTWMKKYGVDNPSKHNSIKKKKVDASIARYGTNHPLKSAEVRDKMYATNLEKFGVKHPSQSPEVFDKIMNTSHKYKDYTTPSGHIRKIQGYEGHVLDLLFKDNKLSEDDVITDRAGIPRIPYILNDEQHYYFPDMYIKSSNTIVEVKSTWTYTKDIQKNIAKMLTSWETGYNFQLYIISMHGNVLSIIRNPLIYEIRAYFDNSDDTPETPAETAPHI